MARSFLLVAWLVLGVSAVASADAPHVTPHPPPTTPPVEPPPVTPPVAPPVAPPPTAPPEEPIITLVPPPPITTPPPAPPVVYVTQPQGSPDHWESQGPEWTVSWVFLALTAATSVATGLVWMDGQSHFRQLQDLCASPAGCTRNDIAGSSAHTSEDWTNALLGVSIGLGAVTILTFIIEGVVTGNRMRYVRGDASREGLRFGVSPFGISLSGSF